MMSRLLALALLFLPVGARTEVKTCDQMPCSECTSCCTNAASSCRNRCEFMDCIHRCNERAEKCYKGCNCGVERCPPSPIPKD